MLDVHIEKKFVSENAQVSFSLDAAFSTGEGITALFGPSGSGKTSILRAIAGILTPDRGRISANGRVYFDSERAIDLAVQQRRVGELLLRSDGFQAGILGHAHDDSTPCVSSSLILSFSLLPIL